jgi:DNA-binding NarL/FixJ family response regulator
MIRLLVVDDHSQTRIEIIRQLTEEGLIKVVAEADTSDSALKLCEKLLPDVVLLDLYLPGLIATRALTKRLTSLRNVKVIAFASDAKAANVHDFIEAGASAYVLKSDPPALVKMAILMVFKGSRQIFSPALPKELTRITQADTVLLRELAKRGGVSKAAARLDINQEKLTVALEDLKNRLELADLQGLTKWARKNGF